MENFIKIDRKMLKWEWYKNEHTKNVFLHCLLKAYWEDTKIEGKIIPRGSFVSTIGNIAEEISLTQMEVRTALKHLKSTNEITSKGTNRNTVFTVTNYDLYQQEEQTKQQTNNEQITNKEQANPLTTNEEYEKNKNIKSKERQEKDTRKEQSKKCLPADTEVYKRIIDYLNFKCNRQYGYNNPSTISYINERLEQGYTENDFYVVINKKSAEWLGDSEMDKYLTPKTLFHNHFEDYLEQKAAEHKSKAQQGLEDFYRNIDEWIEQKEMEKNYDIQ